MCQGLGSSMHSSILSSGHTLRFVQICLDMARAHSSISLVVLGLFIYLGCNSQDFFGSVVGGFGTYRIMSSMRIRESAKGIMEVIIANLKINLNMMRIARRCLHVACLQRCSSVGDVSVLYLSCKQFVTMIWRDGAAGSKSFYNYYTSNKC